MRTLLLIGSIGMLLGLGPAARADKPTETETFDPPTVREAFLDLPDMPEQLNRLLELEQQALALADDEPLKLGSIGSAILDIYPASQTGHFAMGRYYAHVEATDAQAGHERRLASVQADMAASGDGTSEAPFRIMTIYDAHTYARTRDNSPVGSIYQSSEHTHFGLLLVARPEAGGLRQMFFDLTHVLRGFRDDDGEALNNPWPLMRMLASQMDTAAQTAIGAYLTNIQKYDEAIGWLKVASRTGNVLANSLLARIYWTQSERTESAEEQKNLRELSLENHMHAIALGSTDSMYTLANLYLGDYFGEDNRLSAIPLLEQAGELGHAEALLYLAHLYNSGLHVTEDRKRAADYFERAALLDNTQAVLSYGRFLASTNWQVGTETPIFDWLDELADQDNAEAMVILGNLHARGIGTRASNRKAVRWYKRAVNVAPGNADIVNEVAWTLTVSDVEGLKRTGYARRIMDKLMTSDEEAGARPEYLDTWAATHAARGDFEEAIELQERAIAAAAAQEREDVMEILRDHLEQFKAGTSITERAP